jgi:plasmid stability protein
LTGQWQNASIVIAAAVTMATVSVRGIPKAVHEVLRKRAKQHHRSLNGELLEILTDHAERERRRQRLKWVIPQLRRMRERIARKYANAPDSVQLIREDRDSH